MIADGKPILDACCGSRMFWFDKDNPNVEFMDIRDEECTLSDGQLCIVHPNTIGDFTNMPFPDNSFKMVVFDPPHLAWDGKVANLYKRFGKLPVWATTGAIFAVFSAVGLSQDRCMYSLKMAGSWLSAG